MSNVLEHRCCHIVFLGSFFVVFVCSRVESVSSHLRSVVLMTFRIVVGTQLHNLEASENRSQFLGVCPYLARMVVGGDRNGLRSY